MSSQQQYTWDVKAGRKSLVSGLETRDRNQESQEIQQTKVYGVKLAKRVVKSQEIHVAKGELQAKEQAGTDQNLAN